MTYKIRTVFPDGFERDDPRAVAMVVHASAWLLMCLRVEHSDTNARAMPPPNGVPMKIHDSNKFHHSTKQEA